jgi:hypothetical protein
MTDKETLKLALETSALVKDVLKQVNRLVAENEALKKRLAEHAMRETQRLGQEIEQEPEPVISKWSLREVYFDEDGEPLAHRSPPEQEPVALDLSQVNRLTHFKTNGIIDAHKYNITGFVLTNGDGKKCISDMAAVRWFDNKDFFGMMHNEPAYPPQRTEQGWILVPVTLTNDMTSAMADALEDPNNERSSWDLAENMWQAMLPKVPTPPQSKSL